MIFVQPRRIFFLHSFWRITDILIIIKCNQSDNSAFINNQSLKPKSVRGVITYKLLHSPYLLGNKYEHSNRLAPNRSN